MSTGSSPKLLMTLVGISILAAAVTIGSNFLTAIGSSPKIQGAMATTQNSFMPAAGEPADQPSNPEIAQPTASPSSCECPPVMPDTPREWVKARVVAPVRVRVGAPSTNSSIVGVLEAGSPIEVSKEVLVQGRIKWRQVRLEGVENAYVADRLLRVLREES